MLYQNFTEKPPEIMIFSNWRNTQDVEAVVRVGLLPSADDIPPYMEHSRFSWRGIRARLFVLKVFPEDLLRPDGVRMARDLALQVIRENPGFRLVGFGASLKHIFSGKSLESLQDELREKGAFASIGDTFTCISMEKVFDKGLKKLGLVNHKLRVAVKGASGVLGENSLRYFLNREDEVVAFGTHEGRARHIGQTYGIESYTDFSRIGKVDVVVCCNHTEAARLTAERVELVRKEGTRLLVFDPSYPHGYPKCEFERTQGKTVRLEVDVFSSELRYESGANALLGLPEDEIFACFAEFFVLILLVSLGIPGILEHDWMQSDEEGKSLLYPYFDSEKYFGHPPDGFRNYGERVDFSEFFLPTA